MITRTAIFIAVLVATTSTAQQAQAQAAAVLAVADDTVTEQAGPGTEGEAAAFTLSLSGLPTRGRNNVRVFYTLSGFAGEIRNTTPSEAAALLLVSGADAGPIRERNGFGLREKGQGWVHLRRATDIDAGGGATVTFTLSLPNDDGNKIQERIKLRINCVARHEQEPTFSLGQIGCYTTTNHVLGGGGITGNNAVITVDEDELDAVLEITDRTLVEQAGAGAEGEQAEFFLTLENLPTTGTDNLSIFYTVSGFAGQINSNPTAAARLQISGLGGVELQTNGRGRKNLDMTGINNNGESSATFTLSLPNDDGDNNRRDEQITLTINCVARSRTGVGAGGCSNVVIPSARIGGNPSAAVIGVDDDPGAKFRISDASLGELSLPGTAGNAAEFILTLDNLSFENRGDVRIFYTLNGFAGEISNDATREVQLRARGAGPLLVVSSGANKGQGRVDVIRGVDFNEAGTARVAFVLQLPNSDGNELDERITLGIDCVSQGGNADANDHGASGCTTADGNGLVIINRRHIEGVNPAGVIAVDSIRLPTAELSLSDTSLVERGYPGTAGREAVFSLALTNLPANGPDDVSVFYTLSGGGGRITFFGRVSPVQFLPSERSDGDRLGRLSLARTSTISRQGIDSAGRVNVRFSLRLPNSDGNRIDETITLTINCIARFRSGQSASGCAAAGDNRILIAQAGVESGRSGVVTATDDYNFLCRRTAAVGAAIADAISAGDSCEDVDRNLVNRGDLRDLLMPFRSLTISSNSSITALKDVDFLDLPNLETLTLTGNSNLAQVGAGVFDSLVNLMRLDLTDNSSLRALPTGVFDSLVNLMQLDLTGNSSLSALPTGVFDSLVNLMQLNSTGNSSLSALPTGVFDSLDNLMRLDLTGNSSLSALPTGVFDNVLDTLQSLMIDDALKGRLFFDGTDDIDILSGAATDVTVRFFPALTAVETTLAVTYENNGDAADFGGLASQVLRFASGETSKTITVEIPGDTTVDATAVLAFSGHALAVESEVTVDSLVLDPAGIRRRLHTRERELPVADAPAGLRVRLRVFLEGPLRQ